MAMTDNEEQPAVCAAGQQRNDVSLPCTPIIDPPSSPPAAPEPTDAEQFHDLLQILMRGGKVGNYWDGITKLTDWWPVDAIHPTPVDRRDVYFGVHPCFAIPPTNALGEPAAPEDVRSQNDYIAAFNGPYTDFDWDDITTEQALERVQAKDPPPSFVVASGPPGHLHCYWLLRDTFTIDNADDRAEIAAFQAAWVDHVGGDKKAKDLARVLRVPGNVHDKRAKGAPCMYPVRVLAAPMFLYEMDDLQAKLKTNGRPKVVAVPRVVANVQDDEPPTGTQDAWVGDIIPRHERHEYLSREAFKMAMVGMQAEAITAVLKQMDTRGVSPYPTPEHEIVSIAGWAAAHLGPTAPELPSIVVSNRQLPEVTDDVVQALAASNEPPYLFVQAGRLVRVMFNEFGNPAIERADLGSMRGMMARAANFYRVGKDKNDVEHRAGITPPVAYVDDLLKLGHWPFPGLLGITGAPIIHPDGSIVMDPGYDRATCMYYSPAADLGPVEVPETPTTEDVAAALALLQEVIREFPFVSNADRTNALAAIITPVVRALIKGCTPMALVNKPAQGTGATLICEALSAIATGEPAVLRTAPNDNDEWRKTIGSLLQDGRSVVIFDNVDVVLGNTELTSVLTATVWGVRKLGEISDLVFPNRTFWVANGNNLRLGGNIPRRCFQVFINAKVVQPWARTGFAHPQLKAWVLEHRARILGAILTLARAWIQAGEPQPASPVVMGGFEEWVRVVGGILHHAGANDFLGNLQEMYAESDDDTPEWEAFLLAWEEQFGDAYKAVSEVVTALQNNEEFARRLPSSLADSFANMGEGAGGKRRAVGFNMRLGRQLAKQKDVRYADGMWVGCKRGEKGQRDAALWGVKRKEGGQERPPEQEEIPF